MCSVGVRASLVAQRVCLQCGGFRFDPSVGKIPGEGKGYPLQYSCLDNPMDRGVWWATLYRVSESKT